MIVFPNCKLNLGLYIIRKRTDGYHDLETVFYPLPFYDVLEIIHPAVPLPDAEIFISGIEIDSKKETNLCYKAWQLLKEDFPQLPAVKTYLHKTIPVGAGLGGGSADGAFMLMLLNTKFNLQISQQQLMHYALELGSDCPFFILNKTCFAQQRGEILEPLSLNLSGYKLLLVNPGIHINTGWAFTQVEHKKPAELKKIILSPAKEWKYQLINNFESPIFEKYPEIQDIKNELYKSGAIYASMSGSGSTVYGIFSEDADTGTTFFPPHYFVKQLIL